MDYGDRALENAFDISFFSGIWIHLYYHFFVTKKSLRKNGNIYDVY